MRKNIIRLIREVFREIRENNTTSSIGIVNLPIGKFPKRYKKNKIQKRLTLPDTKNLKELSSIKLVDCLNEDTSRKI